MHKECQLIRIYEILTQHIIFGYIFVNNNIYFL